VAALEAQIVEARSEDDARRQEIADRTKWAAAVEEELTASRREIRTLRRELGERLEVAAEATTLREQFELERREAATQLQELEQALADSRRRISLAEAERDALADGVERLHGIEDANRRETADRIATLVARLARLESQADAVEVSQELESLAGQIQELTAAAARVNAVEHDRTVVEHRLVQLGSMVDDGARQAELMESRLTLLRQAIRDELARRSERVVEEAPLTLDTLNARVSQGLAQAEELARQAEALRHRLEDEQIGS
jgi:chromosome segregation ATPase